MTEDKKLPTGWICPSCKTVRSPTSKMCKPCSKDLKEQGANDTKEFLVE